MIKNDLGVVQDCNLRRWTKLAIECYKLGCRCSCCSVPQLFEQNVKCTMKAYVLELVKRYGVPEECQKPTIAKVI